jgi:hypothetical protein
MNCMKLPAAPSIQSKPLIGLCGILDLSAQQLAVFELLTTFAIGKKSSMHKDSARCYY